jgi:uroporphyrinogen-III synthase
MWRNCSSNLALRKFFKRFTASVADHSLSPLARRRVVITRAESQSAALAQALRASGAEVTSLPLIRIIPPQRFAPFDSALRSLANFDWLVFTSQNAVAATAERLVSCGIHRCKNFDSLRVAAVGPATAHAAEAAGFSVAYVGRGGTAADLVEELASDLCGKRILLPRSDRADAALVTQLCAHRAKVTAVVAYRAVPIDSVDADQKNAIARSDAILFFSPSAVNAFHALVKSGVLSALHEAAAVGAIGPVTLSAVGEAGMRCDFQAQEPSVGEIVAALAAYFEKAKISSVSGVASR